MKKQPRWLFYIGLIFLFLGLAASVASIVFELIGYTELINIFEIVVTICGPLAIIILIVQLVVFGGVRQQEAPRPMKENTTKPIKEVEVKEVPKTQDEIMYEKYVELYNKKLISKEDLEKKRIELLGK